jgi:hypothetical protein
VLETEFCTEVAKLMVYVKKKNSVLPELEMRDDSLSFIELKMHRNNRKHNKRRKKSHHENSVTYCINDGNYGKLVSKILLLQDEHLS